MQVYVVLGCMDYCGSTVLAVFSDKEKAEQFRKEKEKNCWYEWLDVEEEELQ